MDVHRCSYSNVKGVTNVLSCRLKAAWDNVLRIDSTRPEERKRKLAQQTWYAAAAEHSRLFQLTIVHSSGTFIYSNIGRRCDTDTARL